MQAWAPAVKFLTRQDPQWDRLPIPTFANWNDATHQASSEIPCQYFATLPNGQVIAHDPVDKVAYHDACNPLFSQLHGFHDANNVIGEATSHGVFVAGLLHVWQERAQAFAPAEREALREAIQANVLYLELLYQEGSAAGEFAHAEMGRGGVETNLGPWQSEFALYGMSAFADMGVTVDKGLARLACSRALDGAQWLESRRYFRGSFRPLGDLPAHRTLRRTRAAGTVRPGLPAGSEGQGAGGGGCGAHLLRHAGCVGQQLTQRHAL